MAKVFEAITPGLRDWIGRQKIFFVATAPLSTEGHINCSPKAGGDTFRILDDHTAAYLDLTGSGTETIAHVQENHRIAIMFCAFEGPPKIVRLHGLAEVVYPSQSEYAALSAQFPHNLGARAVIKIRLTRISDSCGYAVPLMDYRGDRKGLDDWATKQGDDGLADYRREKNQFSIDGLEGYRTPPS